MPLVFQFQNTENYLNALYSIITLACYNLFAIKVRYFVQPNVWVHMLKRSLVVDIGFNKSYKVKPEISQLIK